MAKLSWKTLNNLWLQVDSLQDTHNSRLASAPDSRRTEDAPVGRDEWAEMILLLKQIVNTLDSIP